MPNLIGYDGLEIKARYAADGTLTVSAVALAHYGYRTATTTVEIDNTEEAALLAAFRALANNHAEMAEEVGLDGAYRAMAVAREKREDIR